MNKRVFSSLIAAAIAVALFVRLHNPAKSDNAVPSKLNDEEKFPAKRAPEKRYSVAINLASVTFLALAVICGLTGWILFSSTDSANLSGPQFPTGGLLIFTGKPGEHCTINVNIKRSGFFQISVTSSSSYSEPFLIIASGSAIVTPVNYSQMGDANGHYIPDFSPGEIRTVKGSYGLAHRDKDGFYGPYYRYVIDNYTTRGHELIAAGSEFNGNYDSNTKYMIYGKFKEPIVSSGGSTELGSLPYIGTTQGMISEISGGVSNGPVGPITVKQNPSNAARSNNSYLISSSSKWYAPIAKVNISVTYPGSHYNLESPSVGNGAIPQQYRLDSAAPASTSSGELLWHSIGSARISWSMTNLSTVRFISDKVFISGLLLGAAASFLGISIDRALRAGN